MARYACTDIASMLQVKLQSDPELPSDLEEVVISHLAIDSRTGRLDSETMFIALAGAKRDGHDFIPMAYEAGVRTFLATRKVALPGPVHWILVEDTLEALQKLAARHRARFDYPVIGITGSYGKTIVKEWLAEILSTRMRVLRSPRSYNSQIGVALALWEMEEQHSIALIEAGISELGEMEKLREMIQPTLGVFTNLGAAHDAGFESREEKLREKCKLFKGAKAVFHAQSQELIQPDPDQPLESITWGRSEAADLQILNPDTDGWMQFQWKDEKPFSLPFSRPENFSRENLALALTVTKSIGSPTVGHEDLQEAVRNLSLPDLRMRVDPGLQDSWLVNDAYTSDIDSLKLAAEYAASWPRVGRRTAILSDIEQSGMEDGKLYSEVSRILLQNGFGRLIAVGPKISNAAFPDQLELLTFDNTEKLLEHVHELSFAGEVVLLKGARRFKLETVADQLRDKSHLTRLEVDLDAIAENFRTFRASLPEGVRFAVMVKALGYGSGDAEIARVLSYHRADYLGVAYPDEGEALRRAGIGTPILVMNAKPQEFDRMRMHDLEPEVIDLAGWRQAAALGLRIHLKLDTGMHRLGFDLSQLEDLLNNMDEAPIIASVFTHLAAGDDPEEDEFSRMQLERFRVMAGKVIASYSAQHPERKTPLLHALNTAGIIRFPEYSMDMVRLGVGLYGYDPTGQHKLRNAGRLMSTVTQVRRVPAGETVGYGRSGKVENDMTIATIDIGYADGLRRSLSNGKGQVFIRGRRAPIFGRVCMDMTMIDATDIPGIKVGDEVEIFGRHISLEEYAGWMDTIPYEVLTSVSGRVKRVYFRG